MLTVAWVQQKFPDLSSVRALGQGGQKVVFAASHPSDGMVVLKLISPSTDVERVRREIRAVQQVDSKRVPKIFAVGTTNTSFGQLVWIRERLISGESLRTRIQSGVLNIQELERLAEQLLEALLDAEKKRIVHRDVKPDNVIVDSNGDAWLIDFGISRHLDLQSATPSGAFGGLFTPGYAPPEQCRNQKRAIDARSDLFALGVTLYECACGSNPFRKGARDIGDVLRRIETHVPQPLQIPNDLHDFSAFVSTLMQPRRDHRPGSVSEALDWLREIRTT